MHETNFSYPRTYWTYSQQLEFLVLYVEFFLEFCDESIFIFVRRLPFWAWKAWVSNKMFSFCDVWQKTALKMTFLWKEIEFLLWLRAPNPQWREANWKLTYRMWGMVDIILMRPFVWAWQGQNHCGTEFSIHHRLESCVVHFIIKKTNLKPTYGLRGVIGLVLLRTCSNFQVKAWHWHPSKIRELCSPLQKVNKNHCG